MIRASLLKFRLGQVIEIQDPCFRCWGPRPHSFLPYLSQHHSVLSPPHLKTFILSDLTQRCSSIHPVWTGLFVGMGNWSPLAEEVSFMRGSPHSSLRKTQNKRDLDADPPMVTALHGGSAWLPSKYSRGRNGFEASLGYKKPVSNTQQQKQKPLNGWCKDNPKLHNSLWAPGWAMGWEARVQLLVLWDTGSGLGR